MKPMARQKKKLTMHEYDFLVADKKLWISLQYSVYQDYMFIMWINIPKKPNQVDFLEERNKKLRKGENELNRRKKFVNFSANIAHIGLELNNVNNETNQVDFETKKKKECMNMS